MSSEHITNHDFFVEISRVNNQLVSAQRELAKKNAELVAANTRLELAEQALVENKARLEKSNRDLADFAYIASHDLQEPLRKVQTYCEKLAEISAGGVDEKVFDYLARIQQSTRRMQSLIRDLLRLSQVNTQPQHFTQVDLAEVVALVVSDLETFIEKNNGTVQIGWLPTIEADGMQMHQLMQNLITNALKFHAPGSPVRVTISCQSVNQDSFQIIIEDDGIGFDIQQAVHIFEPFKRLVNRASFEGGGLGLAICKRIVECHHGDISASSEIGKGSKFFVRLPILQEQRETAGPVD